MPDIFSGGRCYKVRHLSRSSASSHIEELSGFLGQTPNAYQCPKCGFWHVGYSQGSQKLSKKARRKRKEAIARSGYRKRKKH